MTGVPFDTKRDLAHDAFCTYIDVSTRVVHQLMPSYMINISTGVQTIFNWGFRCDPSTKVLRKKFGADVVTCVACLAWQGSTLPGSFFK